MPVFGAFELAAEFAHAGGTVEEDVVRAGREVGQQVVEDWMAEIPASPGGYEGAGFTSSPGANKYDVTQTPTSVQTDIRNESFVAGFLQRGTPHHGPKVDLIATADRRVDPWVEMLAEAVEL